MSTTCEHIHIALQAMLALSYSKTSWKVELEKSIDEEFSLRKEEVLYEYMVIKMLQVPQNQFNIWHNTYSLMLECTAF